jgi:hypothetical protein
MEEKTAENEIWLSNLRLEFPHLYANNLLDEIVLTVPYTNPLYQITAQHRNTTSQNYELQSQERIVRLHRASSNEWHIITEDYLFHFRSYKIILDPMRFEFKQLSTVFKLAYSAFLKRATTPAWKNDL